MSEVKKKKRGGLAEKAQEKLAGIRTDNSLDGDTVVSVELQSNLQKLVEGYMLASARAKATKKELETAKLNEDVAYAELQAAYKAVKRVLKKSEQEKKNVKKPKKKK